MYYLTYLKDIPPQLATLIIAALPIAENRVAVPVALGVYHLPVWQALLFSVLGSIIAAAVVVYGLDLVYRRLQGKLGVIDRVMQKVFERSERKFTDSYERWGAIALLLFVAVPAPFTGAWSGAVASFLFGIKPARALLFIALGVILSAMLVALLSLGVITLL